MSLRYFLPLYLPAYVITAFFWRSYAVWKKTGVNPVAFKGSGSAHDFIGRLFKPLFALIVIVVFVHSLLPNVYQYFMPVTWLERAWVRWIGVILLLVSLAWTVLAQVQMGQSWRIGIDVEHETRLVQGGVFKLSRNPIFIGMIATLLGLFLVIPNVGTLITLVVGTILIGIQVRLEEEHLTSVHGEQYVQYRRLVRRWL